MTYRKEGLPSVNDAFRIRRINKSGVKRNVREVDLCKAADPDAPPPDDVAIQGLLQEVRKAKKRKYLEGFFWGEKR